MWEDKGARLTVHLQVKNVGNSPALDVAIEAHQFISSPEHGDYHAEVARFCAEVRRRQIARIGSGQRGEVLFPGESLSASHGLLFARSDVEAAAKFMKINFFSPNVIICVDYRSSITDQSHTTGLAYFLLK